MCSNKWRFFVNLFIIISFLFGVSPVAAQTSLSLDIVVLIDSSGSMGETDPEHLRVSAAYYLLDYVRAVSQLQGEAGRFAVANFDTEIISQKPLTLLQPDLIQGSITPQLRGNTDFRPPLDFAIEQLSNADDQNKKAVFLFTDGEPEPVPDFQDYFQNPSSGLKARIDRLLELGAQVFVIAIHDTNRAREAWINLLGGDNYRSIDSATALAGIYHDMLAPLLGLSVQEGQTTIEDSADKAVTVEPYLEHIVFSLIKDQPQAQVTLRDPNGAILPPAGGGGDNDLHLIYAISRPDGGTWHVLVEGGTAQLWVDRKYATLLLDIPPGHFALNETPFISVRLVRLGQTVVDNNIKVAVDILTPDMKHIHYSLNRQPDGRYTMELPALAQQGEYTLTLEATMGSVIIPALFTPVSFTVLPIPEIEDVFITGEALISQSVTVTARLNNADRAGSETAVRLRVLDSGGQLLGTTDLSNNGNFPDDKAGDDLYSGAVTLSSVAGRYFFEVSTEGRSIDGVNVSSPPLRLQVDVAVKPVVTSSPTVTPPSSTWDFPTQPPFPSRHYQWWLIGLIIGCVAAASGALYYFGLRLKTVMAQLAVTRQSEKDQREYAEHIGLERNEQKERAIRVEQERDEQTKRAERAESEIKQQRERAEDVEKERDAQKEHIERVEKDNADLKSREENLRIIEEYRSKAREAVERGDYNDANRYYHRAVEAIDQFFEKTKKITVSETISICQDWFGTFSNQPEETQSQILRDLARRDNPQILKGLVETLADTRWQAKPEIAVRDLYDLMLADGASPALISAIQEVGRSPLASVYDVVKRALQEPLNPDWLQRAQFSFKKLPGASGKGLAAFYHFLSEMAQYSPLAKPEGAAAEAQKSLEEYGPEVLKSMFALANQAFSLPVQELGDEPLTYLKRLRERLMGDLARLRQFNTAISERALLQAHFHRWLQFLEDQIAQRSRPAELILEVVPRFDVSFEYADFFEEERLGDKWVANLPVHIYNIGDRPAYNVQVMLQAIEPGKVRLVKPSEPTQRLAVEQEDTQAVALDIGLVEVNHTNGTMTQTISVVYPTSDYWLFFRLETLEAEGTTVELSLKYGNEFLSPSTSIPDYAPMESQKVTLRIGCSASSNPVHDIYTRGPIQGENWNKLARGNALSIVEEIIERLKNQVIANTRGDFIRVVGLRRVGKTSILYRVLDKAKSLRTGKSRKYLPVYLDLLLWLDRLKKSGLPENKQEQNLWGAILREIYVAVLKEEAETGIKPLPADLKNELETIIFKSEPYCVGYNDFRLWVDRILRTCNCKYLLLALDEGDAFGSETIDKLLDGLALHFRQLAEANTVILFAHSYAEAEWRDQFDSDRSWYIEAALSRVQPYKIKFLSEEDAQNLAELSGLRFTELGWKTFWQVTGGYPALIHILGGYLVQQVQQGYLPNSISIGDIKRAVREMLYDVTWGSQLDYLRYGFSRHEEVVLQSLAAWYTDKQTGVIRDIKFYDGKFTRLELLLKRIQNEPLFQNYSFNVEILAGTILKLIYKELIVCEDRLGQLNWESSWSYILMLQIAPEGNYD
jgi:hypothetical protein